MSKEIQKQSQRLRRRRRVNIKGTADRPRLSVYKSLKGICAQLIDDGAGKTLVSASSKEIKPGKTAAKTDIAAEVGRLLAKKAEDKGIRTAVFDKGFYKYHGRIKAVADGAREGGLKF